ncbi:hypothetical protein LAZ29_01695 [Cereibacter sphaeroides]|nr:hypothetical protein [Cereibacter sphaeroides]
MNAGGAFTRHDAWQRDQPRPSAPRVEIRQIGVEQQIRASRIGEAPRAQVGLSNGSGKRLCASDQTRNLN